MGLIDKPTLLKRLSPPLDQLLATQLIDEFISLERRFVLRDWEPAELDGGQFAEILARVLYHADSGNLNLTKEFDECQKYVEDPVSANRHLRQPRSDALHLARVLRTVYAFRSKRGAVHISPSYSANHMDARLMIECVRWCFNETLRLFLQATREEVAKTVRELLQFEVPCIAKFEDTILVQRTDLSPEEELLVLLHYAGESGFTRKDLGRFAQCSASVVTTSLQKLMSREFRQVVVLENGIYRLTDLGEKRIREQLAEKLLLA